MLGVSPILIIVAALALYAVFSVLRRNSEVDEVVEEHHHEEVMQRADEEASKGKSGPGF